MSAATLFGFQGLNFDMSSYSPSGFGSPDSSNSDDQVYYFDDDLVSDNLGQTNESTPNVEGLANSTPAPSSDSKDQVKKRGRRPPSTAAKRATHNAIERARRESLNGRFLELARALPNMGGVKRPSKSAIVIKSLEYVYEVQSRERSIVASNVAMKKELEELRLKLAASTSNHHSPSSTISSSALPSPNSFTSSDNIGLGLNHHQQLQSQPDFYFVPTQDGSPIFTQPMTNPTTEWSNVFGSYVLN